MVTSSICVARYKPELATIVRADASSYGLGAVLLQDQPNDERRPVAFASRALTHAEQKYTQIEKEALAVAWAVQRFDEFLRGLQFLIETDHQPLVKLLGSADLDIMSPRVQRFRIRLLPYQFSIRYVPGKFLATADTLSRDPQVSPPVSANNVVPRYLRLFPLLWQYVWITLKPNRFWMESALLWQNTALVAGLDRIGYPLT